MIMQNGEWIRLAEMDLETAHYLFDTKSKKPLEIICFLAHSAAEKILKAFLVAKDVDFPKTHDLLALWKLCVECDEKFEDLYTFSAKLNRYGVTSRYPTEIEIAENNAIMALEFSDGIVSKVKGIMS